MTFATRCPACDTVFRVVHDQLKVADGWVRCGRCEAVFDARGALFDTAGQGVGQPAGDMAAAATTGTTPHAPPAGGPADEAGAAEDAAGFAAALPPSAVAVAGDSAADGVVTPAAAPDPRPVDTGLPPHGPPALLAADPAPAALGVPDAGTSPPADAPAFIRRAERHARWHGPRARGLLAAAAVALLVLLAVQAAWPSRDVLAARWPALDALCAAAGCRVEAPRRLDDLSVDSSSLTRAPSGSAVRLALVLRNRGALAVAMPSVDLTLTDVGGQPTARRVLSPAEMRAASPTLAPGAQAALQTVLAFDGPPPSGYLLEIFYP